MREITATDSGGSSQYSKIAHAKAQAMMSTEGAVILDVRAPDEHTAMRISGSVNIPLSDLSDSAEDLLPDKDALILIYCRSGVRSTKAAMKLLELGYSNVHDFGGILDWPYEVEKG